MTAIDLDAIRARHRKTRVQVGSETHGGPPQYGDVCVQSGCGVAWPCETAALLAEIDRLLALVSEPPTDDEVKALVAVLDPADSSRHSGRLWAGRSLHATQAQEIANAIIAAGFTRRPMPSEDEIARAMAAAINSETGQESGWTLTPGGGERMVRICAATALALFKGAEG
ncbi:MAG TPA: hypothetical protein VNR37_03410 [Microbacteriaceae bacterium]|nr:hypothetical protein [Microbacteriaceae bacterium]